MLGIAAKKRSDIDQITDDRKKQRPARYCLLYGQP